jgi:hypothetical protein
MVRLNKLSTPKISLIEVLFSGYEAFARHNPIWSQVADSWGYTLGPWAAIFVVCTLTGAWLLKENHGQFDAWSWGVKPLGRVDLHNGVAPMIEDDEIPERNRFQKVGLWVLNNI